MKSFFNRRKSATDPKDLKVDDMPPSYFQSVPLQLSFTGEYGSLQPLDLTMQGQSRSADFEVTTTNGRLPLFSIETESTHVFHETYIKDHRPIGEASSWFLKRKVDGDLYTYTINGVGSTGAKLLEVQTTSAILSNSSTRLVFRGSGDGELDALHLKVGSEGPTLSMQVRYQEQTVGQITRSPGDRQPYFKIDIIVPGIDPLLFVILALVVDDRCMTDRRRWRRSAGAGAPGLWNGAVRSAPVLALGL